MSEPIMEYTYLLIRPDEDGNPVTIKGYARTVDRSVFNDSLIQKVIKPVVLLTPSLANSFPYFL